jgi:nitrate reductase NapE component
MIAPPEPNWRKPVGIFLILALILCWAVLVVTLAGAIGHMPWPIEAIYYVVAGVAWIAPLKPLLRWMETGKWRG